MERRTPHEIVEEIKKSFDIKLNEFTKGNPEVLGKKLTGTLFRFYADGFDMGMGIAIEEMSKRCTEQGKM